MDAKEALERHRRVMPSWLSLYYENPIEIVSGRDCRVTDSSGRQYLDFFGGILTTMTGHSVPEVVEAIQRQAAKMIHSSTLYLISPMIELAERISALCGIEGAKVFFTTSGTEANDTALMLAGSFRSSNNMLAVRGSYHGRSLVSLSVTGNPSYSTVSHYPWNVGYILGGSRIRGPLAGLSDRDYIEAGKNDLKDLLANGIGTRIAALIAEPIQGVGGFNFAPDGYFYEIKEILDEHGALFISDEVQTGWGRTGEHFWGYQAHGIVPDILTFAKGIGNGLALAGIAARADVMDAFPGTSISTFGGSPLSAAGGLANLEYLFDNDLQNNAKTVGGRMREEFVQAFSSSSIVGDVRGKGLMIGVEIVDGSPERPSPALASRVQENSRELGLLVGRGGSEGNVLRIAPPLCISAVEAAEGAAMLIEAVGMAEPARP